MKRDMGVAKYKRSAEFLLEIHVYIETVFTHTFVQYLSLHSK